MTAPTKRCSRCKLAKPRTEFHRHAEMADGLQPACRTCSNEYHKAQYAARAERRAHHERVHTRVLRLRHAIDEFHVDCVALGDQMQAFAAQMVRVRDAALRIADELATEDGPTKASEVG